MVTSPLVRARPDRRDRRGRGRLPRPGGGDRAARSRGAAPRGAGVPEVDRAAPRGRAVDRAGRARADPLGAGGRAARQGAVPAAAQGRGAAHPPRRRPAASAADGKGSCAGGSTPAAAASSYEKRPASLKITGPDGRQEERRAGGSTFKDTTETKPAVPPESDKEQKRNLAYLVVLAGVSAGEMFKLQEDKTVVGRGPHGRRAAERRGGLARALPVHARGREDRSSSTSARPTGPSATASRSIARELADGDKIMVGSTTILKFTYHDYLDEVFQRQMYESALRDGLTKVFNKKYFTDYLEKEFAFAARHKRAAGADLPRHRPLQEDQRHARAPGGRLRAGGAVADDGDAAAHRGRAGALRRRGVHHPLPRLRPRAARKIVAERLRRAVEARKFTFGGKDIPVTISLGIAADPGERRQRPRRVPRGRRQGALRGQAQRAATASACTAPRTTPKPAASATTRQRAQNGPELCPRASRGRLRSAAQRATASAAARPGRRRRSGTARRGSMPA